jgi:ubiquitin-conjugating enzyme E2 J2
MSTPSGRFQTDSRLCLTMSDFHPSSWNPSWSVATILNGLLSFMVTDETTTGSIKTTDVEKRIYAARSHKFNTSSSKFRGETGHSFDRIQCRPPLLFILTKRYLVFLSLIDIFPEYCQPEILTRPQHDNAPSNTMTQRRSRTTANANPVALATAQIVADTGASATAAVQQNRQSRFNQWRRWLLVLVVCVYLILAKISSRSNIDSSSNSS